MEKILYKIGAAVQTALFFLFGSFLIVYVIHLIANATNVI
jgi:hypothetical protein